MQISLQFDENFKILISKKRNFEIFNKNLRCCISLKATFMACNAPSSHVPLCRIESRIGEASSSRPRRTRAKALRALQQTKSGCFFNTLSASCNAFLLLLLSSQSMNTQQVWFDYSFYWLLNTIHTVDGTQTSFSHWAISLSILCWFPWGHFPTLV